MNGGLGVSKDRNVLQRLVVLHGFVLLAGQFGNLLLNVLAHLVLTFSILLQDICPANRFTQAQHTGQAECQSKHLKLGLGDE